MNRLIAQPVILYSIILVAVLGVGGTYAYTKISESHQSKNDLLQKGQRIASSHDTAEQVAERLASARLAAQAELARLNLFMDNPGSPLALAEVREIIFDRVYTSLETAFDALSIAPNTGVAPIEAMSAAQQQIQSQIDAVKSRIQEILYSWKSLTDNPGANTSSSAAAQAAAYAGEIQDLIEELESIVDNITPPTSGMPQDDIDELQNEVDEIITVIENAVDVLEQPVVPPAVVQDQQQTVIDAEDEVDDLEAELQDIIDENGDTGGTFGGDTSGNGGTGDPGTGGDTSGGTSGGSTGGSSGSNPGPNPVFYPNLPGTPYIPPTPYVDPTKPKLIEGANTTLVE